MDSLFILIHKISQDQKQQCVLIVVIESDLAILHQKSNEIELKIT